MSDHHTYRKDRIDKEIRAVHVMNRYRWCESIACACMGCVNRSGGVRCTKEEWEQWVEDNPKPENWDEIAFAYMTTGRAPDE